MTSTVSDMLPSPKRYTTETLTQLAPMEQLLKIMAMLRDPENGCPWDIEQSFESIAPYTIEEAYEVDQAIRDGDRESLKSELGDLLFQSVFHARMAEEEGSFTFDDVVKSLCEKMIRRHPHVFAEGTVSNSDAQTTAWEDQKAKERKQRAHQEGRRVSVLDDVGSAFPALMRAEKLQKRAARTGFDWPDIKPVIDKVCEEAGELEEALQSKDKADIEEEYGDLLFVVANLGRHLKLDPELALRKANEKFIRRFRKVEEISDKKGVIGNLEAMDQIWNEVKGEERKGLS